MEKNEKIAVSEKDLLPLPDDSIIEAAQQAERKIEAVKKIKTMALAVTNSNDWIDEGGKPYLQSSGAEKIARLFGISSVIDEPTIEYDEDGHFTYTYRGTFSIKGVSIEAVGTRSSRDPFFSKSHGKEIPPSEISKADVKKAAFTNLTANGITRLLGIRNLTWEELKEAGIKSAGKKVEFKYEGKKKAVQGTAKCNFCDEGISGAEADYSNKYLSEPLCRKHQAEKKTLLGNIPILQGKKNIGEELMESIIEEISGKTCKVKELSLKELQELQKKLKGGENGDK